MPSLSAPATRLRRPHLRLPSGPLCRRALDVLHVGLLFVVDGRVAWWNAAARRLLGPGPEEDLWAAVTALVGRLNGSHAAPRGPAMRSLGIVPTPHGRLRVCGERLSGAAGAPGDVVLVAVERAVRPVRAVGAVPPEDAELRRRFQLTAQELHVARLLTDGLSNARVAVALGISPNTARIHTERVLRKLGVHSRAAVASALARGRSGDG